MYIYTTCTPRFLCSWGCTYVCIYPNVWVYLCMYVYIYLHMYAHIHIKKHTNTDTHTCICAHNASFNVFLCFVLCNFFWFCSALCFRFLFAQSLCPLLCIASVYFFEQTLRLVLCFFCECCFVQTLFCTVFLYSIVHVSIYCPRVLFRANVKRRMLFVVSVICCVQTLCVVSVICCVQRLCVCSLSCLCVLLNVMWILLCFVLYFVSLLCVPCLNSSSCFYVLFAQEYDVHVRDS